MQKANVSQLRLSEQALERIRAPRPGIGLLNADKNMHNVAFRRAGRNALAGRKVIKCPYCGEVLADVDKDKKVTVYRMPSRKKYICHSYRQCLHCKGEVGIVLA